MDELVRSELEKASKKYDVVTLYNILPKKFAKLSIENNYIVDIKAFGNLKNVYVRYIIELIFKLSLIGKNLELISMLLNTIVPIIKDLNINLNYLRDKEDELLYLGIIYTENDNRKIYLNKLTYK